MKRGIVLGVLLSALFLFSKLSKADEGMWLINLIAKLNQSDMEALGLKLTSEEIYSVNNSSIKDAIVSFGGFCTASIVSPNGLLLTNHHCGFTAIVENSSVEHDYVTNGFWAMSQQEELEAKGLFVKFLVRVEDVTDEVLKNVRFEMTEPERSEAVQKASAELIAKATEGVHYEAEVKEIFYGNKYFLFLYEVFNDVRLVGAPPQSIGTFGGETDNWMWPRHTGDFAFFRVYSAPDGKPASFHKDNIPLKTKKWLPISLNGFEESDFSMIIGYPGRTQRNITSYGVITAYEIVNPSIIKIREKKLKIMKNEMLASDYVRLKYADKYARSANFYKYFIGQNKGIQRLNVIERKRQEENVFETWAADHSILKTDYYTAALPSIKMTYEKMPNNLFILTYLREALLRGTESIRFAIRFRSLYNELKKPKPDIKKIEELRGTILKHAETFFKGFVKSTERNLFEAMVELYYNDVHPDYHPSAFKKIKKNFNGNFKAFADMVFRKSIFTDSINCMKFLKKPSLKLFEKDPLFQIALSVDDLMTKTMDYNRSLNQQINKAMRMYLKGLKEMQPERKFYPDANSTMRLTYGIILGYKAADAVAFNYVTFLDGVIAKEDTANYEFIVPEKLKELYRNKDYCIYADKNGNMPVCFIANLDITGGNSGSPVLNAHGELIGITFDANWEAMSMDIAYEPELQRAINVDIRYVLFITDKFAGAGYLLDELEIRKN